MTRSMRRAFTMVELMIVIAIIGILFAMLMPGITGAWGVAQMTQCQTNLSVLHKAWVNMEADRDSTESRRLNTGRPLPLEVYLESRAGALVCPSAIFPDNIPGGGTGDTGGTGGTSGTGGTGGDSTYDDYSYTSEEPDIQLQDVTIGVMDAAGNLLYEIPLAPSPYWSWFQSWSLPDGRTHIGANLDDYFPKDSLGRYTDEDFYFTVEFRGTSPIKVTIGPCDGSANTSYGKWSDFRLNHKAIWNGEKFGNLFAAGHVGEVIDVQKELAKDTSRNLGTKAPVAYTMWMTVADSRTTQGVKTYGFNRGAVQMSDPALLSGRDVPKMDPKVIFILDYPKLQADMTDIGDTLGEKGFFDLIFIDPTPPVNWVTPPGLGGWSWESVQALRHFGKANVLFCDGHIESMEKDELLLSKHKDLWNYKGK